MFCLRVNKNIVNEFPGWLASSFSTSKVVLIVLFCVKFSMLITSTYGAAVDVTVYSRWHRVGTIILGRQSIMLHGTRLQALIFLSSLFDLLFFIHSLPLPPESYDSSRKFIPQFWVRRLLSQSSLAKSVIFYNLFIVCVLLCSSSRRHICVLMCHKQRKSNLPQQFWEEKDSLYRIPIKIRFECIWCFRSPVLSASLTKFVCGRFLKFLRVIVFLQWNSTGLEWWHRCFEIQPACDVAHQTFFWWPMYYA